MLRSMSQRLTAGPASQAILRQLDILLNCRRSPLPAAKKFGRLLVEADLLSDAHELYRELGEQFPEEPQGLAGMAHVAMLRQSWQEALTCWDELIARFSDKLVPYWPAGRATALMQLSNLDEAEIVFRGLTRDFNDDPEGFVGLARIAMARGLWRDALARWDEVLARFGDQDKPGWQAGRATALTELEQFEEAESIFQHLALTFPARSNGFVGLATIATRTSLWQEALARWDEVIARFSGAENPHWQASRAHLLLGLGRGDEAEATFRKLIDSAPDSPIGLLGLLRLLIAKGKPEQAALELDTSPFRSTEIPEVIERKFDILIGLKRFAEARAEFQRILSQANDLAMLNALFTYTAPLHNGWQRTEAFVALLSKTQSLPSLSKPNSPAAPGLRARILLALRDYKNFVALVTETGERTLGEHWRGLLAVASKLRAPSFPDYHATRIFGIGMCRTGTTSLASALTALGFHTLDWVNPLTRELMCEDDFHLFDAFTDAPACASFEKQYFMFPNSKFIYTVRPLESWKKSMENLFSRVYGHSRFEDLKVAMAQSEKVHYGADFSNIYLSLYFNHKNYEEAYAIYDQRVRRFFQDKPKDRFLEFDVFAGRWDELCGFTGRAKPASPFPWLNRKL
jgi:tetratricopeptide (TPR) repeat protein